MPLTTVIIGPEGPAPRRWEVRRRRRSRNVEASHVLLGEYGLRYQNYLR
jgi:hypothetical protein